MTMQFATPALLAPRMTADFEARSEIDLTEVGAWKYSEDPSTKIICLSYAFGNEPAKLWTPWLEEDVEVFFEEKVTTGRGKTKVVTMEKRSCMERQMVYRPELCPFPQEIIDFIAAGGVIEAHSAQMERSLWLNQLHRKLGVPMPTRWLDTQATCAYRGLPLSLDDVGEVLNLDVLKDKEGKTLIRLLCKPQKITKKMKIKQVWNNDPDLFKKMFLYCMQDVNAERSLAHAIGDLTPSEYRLWVLDQTINYRGVRLDFDAVYAAKSVVEKATMNMEAELVAMTNGEITTGGQRDRIVEWLKREHKIEMPNMQAGTLKETLKDRNIPVYEKGKPETYARRMLEIRRELSRTSTDKIYTMIACACHDGRIRGLLQYHGAGTGRWAGRLVQPQNFPRPKIMGKPFKGKIDDLIAILMFEDPAVVNLCYGPEMEAIAAALRGMFIAADGCEFLTSDFSSIEARIVLWLAGQTEAMDIFNLADAKKGPDIYCHLAGQIYGRRIDKEKDADERQLGKIGVLGCGYQMGAARLQEQAHDDYELDLELELCQRIVSTYRETYDKVPIFWNGINRTACDAVIKNKPMTYRGITYEPITDRAGKWLACRLPSGRRIWYYNPSITMEPMPWNKDDIRPKLWYEGRDNKRGGMWSLISTYGGMLTENIVQAIARDIMCEAMLRAELAGYKIILTVHDEIVSEIPIGWGSQQEFDALMAQNPVWCQDMPIAVEGWRGPRYKK